MTDRVHAERQGAVLHTEGLSGVVLQDLDLSLHPGEIVGVAGLTGCGREELPQLLVGMKPASSGEMWIGERLLKGHTPERAMGLGIGFVTGERPLAVFPDMTVQENMTMSTLESYVRAGVLRTSLESEQAGQWADRFSLRPRRLKNNIMALSGGNQQKALIARMLMQEPTIIVLDDPTRGVDIGAKSDIHEVIDRAADSGAAVLLCSSDNEELSRLCDRTLVLRRGQVVQQLDRAETTAAALNQAML